MLAIVLVIDAPLKGIQCTSMDLFTVSDSDYNSDCDVTVTKFQMGVAPKFNN